MRNNLKLDPLLAKDLTEKLKEILISKNTDGSYSLFGKYKIVPNDQGLYSVKVLIDINKPEVSFSSLKHAVTWCTFDQLKKYKESRRVEEIDLLLDSEEVNIVQLQRRIQTCVDVDEKSILFAKFYNHRMKKRALIAEIERYVSESKYYQSKKFEQCAPKNTASNDKYSNQEWK